ncbi:helix-turn-helix transcriptional regulator [Nonomuraea sp. NPDC050663]|uniref:helix-turn-helix transcriptional regulator n=1 Tax=Nonomuraea sp. NPDC050663 TaxID=3364370 RepID=UPI0037B747D5
MLSSAKQELLSLLARGYKDEQIARLLGMSVRTVRRDVSVIMDLLKADSRFQLGWSVRHLGIVSPTPQPHVNRAS